MPLTRDLGALVSQLAARGASAEARAVAKVGFIDSIGTMIAGSGEEATRILHAALAPLPGSRSRLWFGRERCAAPEAALLNGVAAHALDFDDVALRGHPSAVLVPAILAEAQELGCRGTRMLDAYVAGYEVWAELVERERDIHHTKGWHPTGVFGAIGAAAACAALRRLDSTQCAHALGLGASQSSGIMANFGSMAKPFHAGRAAQSGILSARLAACGFTASLDALEHPHGLLAAISPRGNVDRERPIAVTTERLQITQQRMSLKKYPTCYYTHRALDALLSLLARMPIDHRDVTRIDVTMSREHALVLRNHAPADALAAKFSIEFAMSGALVAGRMGLAELSDGFVRSAAVQRLYGCVHVAHADAYDADWPGAAASDQVTITTSDGRRLMSDPIRHARGHARAPLSHSELREKFLECVRFGGYDGDGRLLFERLNGIEQLDAIDL